MSKKDEFVALMKVQSPWTPSDLEEWRERVGRKSLAKFLNDHPVCRKAFREAVAEAKDVGEEEQAGAGLSKLFGGE